MAASQDNSMDLSNDTTVKLLLTWFVDPSNPRVDVAVYFNLGIAYKAILDRPPQTVFNPGGNEFDTTFTFRRVPSGTPGSFNYFPDQVFGKKHNVIAELTTGGNSQAKTTAILD